VSTSLSIHGLVASIGLPRSSRIDRVWCSSDAIAQMNRPVDVLSRSSIEYRIDTP